MEENKNEELKNEEVVENIQPEENKAEEANIEVEEVTSEEAIAEETTVTEENASDENSFFKKNAKWIKIAGGVIAALILVLIVINAFSRSPKATVKQFISGINSYKAKKVMDTISFEGMAAYAETYTEALKESDRSSFDIFDSSLKGIDMSDFKDDYKEAMDDIKDMDKDEKKEYKEKLKKVQEDFQELLDKMKDKDLKVSVKVTKVVEIKGSKLLKEVIADVSFKKDGYTETSTMRFITMKKGLKNYIVSEELTEGLSLIAEIL